MNFRFIITATVNHVSGKFAGSDEIETQIQDALENADPMSYSGDGGGEYETGEWEVSSESVPVSPAKILATMREITIKECARVIREHWESQNSRNTAAASSVALLSMLNKRKPKTIAPKE